MKLKTRDMILAALFAALTVVGAKINLLLPDIPVTLQPFIVMLAGSLSGGRNAFLSQAVYITAGLIGIPVFAKPVAGPAYMLQPSFGYLLGFLFGAYVIGWIIEKSKSKKLHVFLCANIAGLIVIYFFGTLYIYGLMNVYLNKNISISKAFMIGVAPFFAKDAALSIAVSALSHTIYHRVKSILHKA